MYIKKQKLIKVINEALSQFEFHEQQEDSGREDYWSFKLDVIGKTPLHRLLSDYIYASDLSHNYAYTITVEALEGILEAVECNQNKEINTDDDTLNDDLRQYANNTAPIYNADIMDFVSENPYKVDDAIAEFGKADTLIQDGQEAYALALEHSMRELLEKLVDFALE